MKHLVLALSLLFAVAACKGGATEPSVNAQLKLSRRGGDRIAVELVNGPTGARALEVVFVVEGGSGFDFDTASAPEGLPLDSVRIAQAGESRAILFAGDKRGVRLPASGEVATFSLRGGGGDGRLTVQRAMLTNEAGQSVPIDLGATLSVR